MWIGDDSIISIDEIRDDDYVHFTAMIQSPWGGPPHPSQDFSRAVAVDSTAVVLADGRRLDKRATWPRGTLTVTRPRTPAPPRDPAFPGRCPRCGRDAYLGWNKVNHRDPSAAQLCPASWP